MNSSPLIDQLIEAFRCLPGVGPKSAQRMTLQLLERNRVGAKQLSNALAEALEKVGNQRLQKRLQKDKNEFQQKSNNK